MAGALILGCALPVLSVAFFVAFARRLIARFWTDLDPLFPTPPAPVDGS
jgi:hypothetical protein